PDGAMVAYVANRQLFLRRLDELESHAFQGAQEDVGSPLFSPDGRWIGFYSFQDAAIKKIAITGGAAVTLCTGCTTTLGYGMSWEGDTVVFGQGSQTILAVPQTGGKPEVWVKAESNEAISGAQLLPGGDELMFSANKSSVSDSWQKADIVVFSRKTGQRKVVIQGGTTARYLNSGYIVYSLGANLYAVPFDIQQLKTTAEPIPIVEKVMRAISDYGLTNFDFSKNGTLIYVPSSSASAGGEIRQLVLVDRRGKASAIAALASAFYGTPRVSPDGKYVALEVLADGSISIYDLSGKSQLRRLTLDGNNLGPVWSFDGNRIAYRSNRQGKPGIFVQNFDGTGIPERLTTAPSVPDVPFTWSPDGNSLVFTRDNQLWLLPFTGERKTQPFSEGGAFQYNASFSPDG